ncbi:MAG: AAA family ATPase [Chloroflexota bacterium]|nr:AAA family ATPase [Chloroflexota bacterium]
MISELERGSRHQPRRDTAQLLADGLRLTGPDRDSFLALARGRAPAAAGASIAGDRPPQSALPVAPAPIIGRLKEIAAATALLLRTDVRLLRLTGPGGVGKTRLTLEVAARTEVAFTDGAVFVDLAPVDDPAIIRQSIGEALGRRFDQDQVRQVELDEWLRDRPLLLVLDNFEHLIAGATVVADLLAACPGMTVLATSREVLRIRAERHYDVAPLALPDLESMVATDELTGVPAVQLFVDRAESANRTFALTAENARSVAEIVVRLGGLPLGRGSG